VRTPLGSVEVDLDPTQCVMRVVLPPSANADLLAPEGWRLIHFPSQGTHGPTNPH
jgi:hypothetical protein